MADHKPGCDCKVCRAWQAAEEHRKAAAGAEQTRRDSAWLTVMASGGPDAVIALARRHGDPARAVRLLTAAGLDAAGITERWRADAPQQHSSSGGAGPWAGSPDHDERVTRALVQGASDGELSKIREQVTAEYRQAAVQRAARRQSSAMWATRDGSVLRDGSGVVMGASLGPDGAPAQRSVVHAEVPELGSDHG